MSDRWIECECPTFDVDWDINEEPLPSPDDMVHCSHCGGEHRAGDVGQFHVQEVVTLSQDQWRAAVRGHPVVALIDWQPMVNAPKDGRQILVYCGSWNPCYIVSWDADDKLWRTDSRLGLDERSPPRCWAELTVPDLDRFPEPT